MSEHFKRFIELITSVKAIKHELQLTYTAIEISRLNGDWLNCGHGLAYLRVHDNMFIRFSLDDDFIYDGELVVITFESSEVKTRKATIADIEVAKMYS